MRWLIYAAEAVVVFDVVMLGLLIILDRIVQRRMVDLASIADWSLWQREGRLVDGGRPMTPPRKYRQRPDVNAFVRTVVGRHRPEQRRIYLLNERGDLLVIDRRVSRGRMWAERCERLQVETNWRPRLLAMGVLASTSKAA